MLFVNIIVGNQKKNCDQLHLITLYPYLCENGAAT